MKTEDMIISTSELMSAGAGSKDGYEFDVELHDEDEIKFPEPIHVKAVLTNQDVRVMAEIEAKGSMQLVCSRCATEYTEKFDLTSTNYYTSNEDGVEDKIDEEGNIDILPLVRETIILSVPMKNLCKSNCKGLISES